MKLNVQYKVFWKEIYTLNEKIYPCRNKMVCLFPKNIFIVKIIN